MFLQLKRPIRIRVGWLVALAYLFCVLAPAAVLAAGNAPAPCLSDELQVALVPAYHQAVTHPVHAGGAMHDHAGMHAHQHVAVQDAPAGHQHHGKGSPGPCCAMMCVTALPADLPNIAKPVRPISACAPEIALRMHSEAPPLLYRPPIA